MIEDFITPDWDAPANVVAISTTRQGGVSQAPFESLNLGAHVDDDPLAVTENRRRLSAALSLPREPHWLQQVHGTEIVTLGAPEASPEQRVIADGAFTMQPGQVCAVMTADCLPLLLCNRNGDQVAAVHAGWRGMAAGVIERAVQLFADEPGQLLAWAGPSISQQYFEIGNEVREQLGGSANAYRDGERSGKCYADLYALAGERLAAIGVTNYSHVKACTYTDQQRFFSHRRNQHTGRMATLIYFQAAS